MLRGRFCVIFGFKDLNPESREGRSVGQKSGQLYIVSTPIGNLEDITLRALRMLKEVDIIAAEDTRRTRQLLAHYQIKGPRVTSYHDHNKERKTPLLIRQMLSGQSVAVVSDAGTPGISDPAYFLVKRTLENQIPATPIPGVSAPMAAVVISGLPTDRFVFEGFLPARKSRRRKRLQELKAENRTVLLFESPHRILQLLTDAYQILGDREVCLCRELTKRFEETLRGKLSQIIEHFEDKKPRGEFVLVIRGAEKIDRMDPVD